VFQHGMAHSRMITVTLFTRLSIARRSERRKVQTKLLLPLLSDCAGFCLLRHHHNIAQVFSRTILSATSGMASDGVGSDNRFQAVHSDGKASDEYTDTGMKRALERIILSVPVVFDHKPEKDVKTPKHLLEHKEFLCKEFRTANEGPTVVKNRRDNNQDPSTSRPTEQRMHRCQHELSARTS
jgi:hypothetical protein